MGEVIYSIGRDCVYWKVILWPSRCFLTIRDIVQLACSRPVGWQRKVFLIVWRPSQARPVIKICFERTSVLLSTVLLVSVGLIPSAALRWPALSAKVSCLWQVLIQGTATILSVSSVELLSSTCD